MKFRRRADDEPAAVTTIREGGWWLQTASDQVGDFLGDRLLDGFDCLMRC
jgi:hypothetical protein